MLNDKRVRTIVSTVAATCLLGVALPQTAVLAKEKVKPAPATSSEMQVDYSVDIPSIDAVDANVSDDILADVLSGNIAGHAEELAALDATSISVPEIVVSVSSESDGSSQEATITLAGVLLNDVVDGKAGTVSIESISLVADDVTSDFGAMSAANLDIGGILGVYGLVDAGGQTELEVIYTDLVAEGGTLVSEEVSCTIGGVSGAEFKARPPQDVLRRNDGHRPGHGGQSGHRRPGAHGQVPQDVCRHPYGL